MINYPPPAPFSCSFFLSDQRMGGSGMSSLASMMGVSLDNSVDAINAGMFPDVVHSVPFIFGLFDLEVSTIDGELSTTLLDYMLEHQRRAWWSYVLGIPGKAAGWLVSLFSDDAPECDGVLRMEDHARAIDLIFHKGRAAETYNIGGFNEWKNIDIIRVVIRTVDRLLGNPEGHSLGLITYVADRLGHDARYAIDSTKLQRELGWEPSLQFEEGIEKTVRWYLDNQEWMDKVTSGEYQRYYDEMYKGR